jgi:hypothetical protein
MEVMLQIRSSIFRFNTFILPENPCPFFGFSDKD